MPETKQIGKGKCWLCCKGNIVETIEKNFKVQNPFPGTSQIYLPRAKVGRCDNCHEILYALKL